MTTQKIAIGLVAVALFVGSLTAHAAELSAGVKAAERGDHSTALRIFQQLAEQGNANAQSKLGHMYLFGWGVTQDYAPALKWLCKAANQGEANSQAQLGAMYDSGWSGWDVAQDYVQAHMWYNLAAAQGIGYARKWRDRLAGKMTPAQIDEAHRLAREWKPKGK